MNGPALAVAAYWAPVLETIADIAFAIVIVALAVELVSGRIAKRFERQIAQANELKIAELNNETARLRAQDALTNDALLSAVRAGRDNAIASVVTGSVTEALAVGLGSVKRETASEATRVLYIVPKVESFAGKQFDAVVASTAIDIGGLLLTLKSALTKAGWIEVKRDDPTAGVGLLSMSRAGGPALVRIDVDASKDSELLDAAKTLASALNDEGVAATVNPKTGSDTNASVIHILVGPKP